MSEERNPDEGNDFFEEGRILYKSEKNNVKENPNDVAMLQARQSCGRLYGNSTEGVLCVKGVKWERSKDKKK